MSSLLYVAALIQGLIAGALVALAWKDHSNTAHIAAQGWCGECGQNVPKAGTPNAETTQVSE